MTAHAERDHASWSASATERNWSCPGALALTIDLPETTSEAADWGTVAHEVSELCLRKGDDPIDYLGQTRKGKKFSFEVDEEMVDCIAKYVSYVRRAAIDAAPQGTNPATLLQIEQKFSLETLKPPFDAGGTGDAVIYAPALKRLEIVDLKTGRGKFVSAEENKQLRTYALGALLSSRGLAVETVKATIIQPRIGNGEPRSEEFHVADLIEWTGDLLAAMRRSRAAMDRRNDTSEAAWSAEFLTPGDHCSNTFCKAQGFCPALQQQAYDKAGVWFDDLDQPRLANSPDALSPEQAAQVLDAADMIEGWINAVRAFWHGQAESGVDIPNYVLVARQGREKWKEGLDIEAARLARSAGIDEAKIFNDPKIRTPKQVRDALAKAKAPAKIVEAVKELSLIPDNGTNLVRATKTTRPPVQAAVHKHLDILD